MSELREYIVTLKSKDDLESFYNDMETPGGDLCIPDRSVAVVNRRVVSRNTHYMLSNEEAEQIKNDPRVLAVSLRPEDLGMVVTKYYTQTSTNFDKSGVPDVNDINWGMLRVFEGVQRPIWGTNQFSSQPGTVKINGIGTNVDVVIVDGHFNPLHPEYAVNEDGTGGSRVVQFNWFSLNPQVTGGASGNYVYTPYDNGVTDLTDDNSHGSHCAGTACGNRQGWARGSNIYNINPYGTNPNSLNALNLFDYIRVWHSQKLINPNTGYKNPTITNNSWGYAYQVPISNISSVLHRGILYNGPFINDVQLANYGVMVVNISGTLTAIVPARYPALEADIEDAMEDGVLMVGAAGNEYAKIDISGGIDFDNYFTASLLDYYYHEGGSPSSANDVICVGSIGTVTQEYKSNFSNSGPRIDIWAPGSNIQSSVNSSTSYAGNFDPRDPTNTFYLAKISGTSMASPQVTGVLACALETYPWMTQQNARDYLFAYAKTGQVGDTGGSYSDASSIQDAPNRYLYKFNETPLSGMTYPKKNYWLRDRQQSNKVWPRPRIRRFG
jgi:hypothetical protein